MTKPRIIYPAPIKPSRRARMENYKHTLLAAFLITSVLAVFVMAMRSLPLLVAAYQ